MMIIRSIYVSIITIIIIWIHVGRFFLQQNRTTHHYAVWPITKFRFAFFSFPLQFRGQACDLISNIIKAAHWSRVNLVIGPQTVMSPKQVLLKSPVANHNTTITHWGGDRRHFQIYFWMNVYKSRWRLRWVCSLVSNKQYSRIGSEKGLAPTKVCFLSLLWNYRRHKMLSLFLAKTIIMVFCHCLRHTILDSTQTAHPVTWSCLSVFWDNGTGVTKLSLVASHKFKNIN